MRGWCLVFFRSFAWAGSLAVCSSTAAFADDAAARANLDKVIAMDDARVSDAKVETVNCRSSSASTTVALIGGLYSLYASGEAADERIAIDVVDKGTGAFIGRFGLGGGSPALRGTLMLERASILNVTVRRVGGREPAKRGPAYDVAIGFLGPTSAGRSTKGRRE